jgi:phage tail-like protein
MFNHTLLITGMASLAIATALPAVTLAAHPGAPEHAGDPAGNYNFRVEIEGEPIAGFATVSGLTAETEVVEYRAGGDSLVRKLPGRLKYSNIVLKRGYVSDDVLHDWVQATLTPGGVVERRDGALILQDKAGTEIVRYRFYDGWPCKWEGPTHASDGTGLATETVVLCIDWFEED